MKNKFGQEEMVGFALILILVAIIILVFIGFSIRNPEKESVESYEVESFLHSTLQYTSECENNIEKLSIKKLIVLCNAKNKCLDERDSCDLLKIELENILNESWQIGEERPVKGYELTIRINENNQSLLEIKKGEITKSLKGSSQPLSKGMEIFFKAYY